MVHAANPKALLYFGSIVPQFLRPEKPLLPQIATLGLLHLLTALTVLLSYGLFAAQVRAYARNPWFRAVAVRRFRLDVDRGGCRAGIAQEEHQ